MSKTYKLPTTNKPISDDISDYTLLIAGEKKAGKTAFCIQFPDNFVLEMEPGNAKHLKCNYEDCRSYEDIIGYIELLENNPDYCTTLIIDDVVGMYFRCMEYINKKQKIPINKKWGYDEWGMNKRIFSALLTRINNLKPGKIYTCHVTNTLSITRAGKESNRLEPNYILSKQCSDVVESICPFHFGGVITFNKDNKREMIIEGDDKVFAFNGFDNHFLDAKGKRMVKIDMGSSPEQAYKNFMLAFNNQQAVKKKFSIKLNKSGL